MCQSGAMNTNENVCIAGNLQLFQEWDVPLNKFVSLDTVLWYLTCLPSVGHFLNLETLIFGELQH